jgi:hypothetical protein
MSFELINFQYTVRNNFRCIGKARSGKIPIPHRKLFLTVYQFQLFDCVQAGKPRQHCMHSKMQFNIEVLKYKHVHRIKKCCSGKGSFTYDVTVKIDFLFTSWNFGHPISHCAALQIFKLNFCFYNKEMTQIWKKE